MKARKKTEKSFDCVASKRKAQSRIYRHIKGLTAKQEAVYFDKATQTGPFAQLWKELVAKDRKARTSGKLATPARRTA